MRKEDLNALLTLIDATGFDDPCDPATWNGPARMVALVRSDHEPSSTAPAPLGDDDEVDIAIRDLAGHPAHDLAGFVAPDSWMAIAVLAYGWGGEPGTLRPSHQPDRRRMRVLHATSRTGEAVAVTRADDGTVVDTPPLGGLVPDTIARALGLPTPPPERPVSDLFSAIWLAEVVATAQYQARRLSWPEVACLHPAARILGARPEDDLPVEAVADLAGALARVVPWSEARWLNVTQGWLSTVASPELAAWMDDGMFARSALAAYDLASAAVAAESHLTAAARAKVERTLAVVAADAIRAA